MAGGAVRIVVGLLVLALLAGCGQSRVVKREGAASDPRRSSVDMPRDGAYVVKRGDTLYGIAFRHGLDYRDVAAWNRIGAPYTIYPGQRLRLRAGAAATAPRAPVSVAASPAIPPARQATTPPAPAPAQGARVATPTPASPAPARPAPATPAPTPVPPAAPATVPSPAPIVPATVSATGWRWPAQGSLVGRFVAGDPKRQGIDIAGTAGQPVWAAADGVVVYSGAGLVGYGELIIVKHSDEWLSAYAHNRRRLVAEGTAVKAGQQIAELGRSGTSRDMLHFEVRRNGKPVDPLQVLPPP